MTRKDNNSSYNPDSLKIEFPNWKLLLRKLAREHAAHHNLNEKLMLDKVKSHLDLIQQLKLQIKGAGKNFHPAQIYEPICNACCLPPKYSSITTTKKVLEQIPLPTNTFHCVFDIQEKDFSYVDPKIEQILGIPVHLFNLSSLLGFNPENPLFHPVDMPHSIRLGALAYLALSIPGLEFRAMEDYFGASYRIGVSGSQIESIRNLEFVTLDKSVFMLNQREINAPLPTQLLYRISIYSEDYFNGISPKFVSDPFRSIYMNAFHYLYHAQLLGIGTKYLLLLDERSRIDRNKVIANSINDKIHSQGIGGAYLDEGQVADCFAKTIRPKLSDAINIWENRIQKLQITSDQEAIAVARTLGLLPIPKKVLEIIYKHISIS